jgi:prepilin-type N-terminal cleavage/methylation domain-containing protein/prepilin-type processing-associated H-X9-DG protein
VNTDLGLAWRAGNRCQDPRADRAPTNNSGAGGFTLIELLVVIAILAALLLPVLARSKSNALRVQCASNRKQQSVACVLYSGDYREFLPTLDEGDGPADCVGTYWNYGGKVGTEYYGNLRLVNPYVSIQGTNITTNSSGVALVFKCPSDNGALAGWWPDNRLPTVFDCFGMSYLYNSSADNNDGVKGLFEKKVTMIRSTSRVIMVNCYPFNVYFLNSGVFQFIYWHDRSRLGCANVAFVDGHVDYLQATKNKPDFQHGPTWTFNCDDL